MDYAGSLAERLVALRSRRFWWAEGALVVLIAVLVAVAGWRQLESGVSGVVVVDDALRSGAECRGAGGYAGLGAGSVMRVYDDAGHYLATVRLPTGRLAADGTCEFSFRLPTLAESVAYRLEIDERWQAVVYSAEINGSLRVSPR